MEKIISIKKIEKYGLENLTKILLYGWILIGALFLFQQIFCIINKFIDIGYYPKTISLTEFITITGAIFVFWYGYKKYERDKELEIIGKYAKEYNNIKKIKEGSYEELQEKYNSLLNIFYEEFYLKSQNYISEELWNEWDRWITLDIYKMIEDDTICIEKACKGENIDKNLFKNQPNFIYIFASNFLRYYKPDNAQIDKKTFIEYIILKITNLEKTCETKVISPYQNIKNLDSLKNYCNATLIMLNESIENIDTEK